METLRRGGGVRFAAAGRRRSGQDRYPTRETCEAFDFVGRGVLGENDWFVCLCFVFSVLCRASTSMYDVVARRVNLLQGYLTYAV